MAETLGNKQVTLLSLTSLRTISKARVVCFLMGLTLMLLIMASYNLTWDKTRLPFTTSPNQVRPGVVQSNKAAAEVSSENNLIDMKQLVEIINSKLDYTPRKVPDEKDVIEMDPHLFSVIPRHFLPGVKSPCWYEEISSESSTDPYRHSFYCHGSRCNNIKDKLPEYLQHRDGKLFRLRCLPYFYIVGQPKCGTTDLYSRLRRHPQVQYSMIKESKWWNRRRFGYILIEDGFKGIVPVEDYLDLFDKAAQHIQEEINRNSSGDHHMTQFITVEASPSVMWNNIAWSYVHKERKETEPGFLTQDFIHTLQPGAKIIMILRDPVERLYSHYLYSRRGKESRNEFHQMAIKSVRLFQSCLSKQSLRACAYKGSLFSAMPLKLNVGLYVVFLLDWLTVFHKDQILVLRLEDYAANMRATLRKAFDFLGLSPLSVELEEEVMKQRVANSRGVKDKKVGPMLPATRDLLREFHQPFNRKLASVLDHNGFLWSYP
ncbi:carbohydrate sulfotransferase 15-like [Chelmon rostratus]|uniref:carbohydrate sulfotransferase 15-like n=1 Tax=Chelmon rostratus TaxID=109905 RepID=UPI001BEA9F76|nr:carbohydrate sulfotransferase 15-like [Chelmon rostratus]XP_041803822.1 carbohydrate sulfotransferase 15-like [Chelmon rostratus]